MFSGYLAIGVGVIIFMLGLFGALQYERANSLLKQNAKLDSEIVHHQAVINSLTNSIKETQDKINFIGDKMNIIHSNSVRQVEVFDKHDLNKLLEKKPELIEDLANKATEKALKRIEEITNPAWRP